MIKKHNGGPKEDGFINLRKVEMYEDHRKEFAFCKKYKQSKNKNKATFYYSVSENHKFDFCKLKRDKTVMEVLKQRDTIVLIDKFHRKAIKEFGFC